MPRATRFFSSRLVRTTSLGLGGAMLALMLATTPASAAGVTPAQATPVQREQAQSRFVRGRERFSKGKFDEAITEFSASLDIVTSPNTRLYLGRSMRERGRLVAAYVEFGRTEVEARELSRDDPRYEKAGQSAHEERVALEPKLGFVNIDVTNAEPNTTMKVAGDEIRRGGWSEPVPVMPGKSVVVVETPGRKPIERSVSVAAGERQALSIDAAEGWSFTANANDQPAPPQRSEPNKNLRLGAYVAGGVAVVGLGLFTVFGLQANGTYSDLEKACNNGPCPPSRKGDIDDGRTQQTVANVGLAVAVIGAAAGATLFVLSMPKASSSSTAARAKVEVGPSFVGLRGAF